MKISRENQMVLADFALRLLARGICAVSMFDKRVASDVAALGGGFSFTICAGLSANAAAVRLITENGRFVRVSADAVKHTDADTNRGQTHTVSTTQTSEQDRDGTLPPTERTDADANLVRTQEPAFAQGDGRSGFGDSSLVIRFKDVSGLLPVVTGAKSIETAFAQHRMVVFGNINQAVTVVRIISITEAYLFPKLMIKKAMRRIPKKQVPSLFVYITLLFFGVKKPPHTQKPAAGQPETVEEIIPDQDNECKEELEAVK